MYFVLKTFTVVVHFYLNSPINKSGKSHTKEAFFVHIPCCQCMHRYPTRNSKNHWMLLKVETLATLQFLAMQDCYLLVAKLVCKSSFDDVRLGRRSSTVLPDCWRFIPIIRWIVSDFVNWNVFNFLSGGLSLSALSFTPNPNFLFPLTLEWKCCVKLISITVGCCQKTGKLDLQSVSWICVGHIRIIQ